MEQERPEDASIDIAPSPQGFPPLALIHSVRGKEIHLGKYILNNQQYVLTVEEWPPVTLGEPSAPHNQTDPPRRKSFNVRNMITGTVNNIQTERLSVKVAHEMLRSPVAFKAALNLEKLSGTLPLVYVQDL